MTSLKPMPPGLVLCKPRGTRRDWKHKTKTGREAHVSVNQRETFIHELRHGGTLMWMNVATSVMSVYQLRVNTHRGPPAAESDEHSVPPHGPPFEFPSIPTHAQAFSTVRRKAGSIPKHSPSEDHARNLLRSIPQPYLKPTQLSPRLPGFPRKTGG